MIKGIDVSRHQGKIDWGKVKAAGVDFAILRVGWTHYDGGLTADDRFHENAEGATAAGLPIGVYAYGYDLTAEAARIGAERVLEAIRPYRLEYPVWYDQEYEEKIAALTRQQRTDVCQAFMDTIQAGGYYTGLYASRDWLERMVYDQQLIHYDKWVAAYRFDLDPPGEERSGYLGTHGMWQYTVIGRQGTKGVHYWTEGEIPGIAANCDLNVSYRDYPAVIRGAGLNHLELTASEGKLPSTESNPGGEAEIWKEKAARYDRLVTDIKALLATYEGM